MRAHFCHLVFQLYAVCTEYENLTTALVSKYGKNVKKKNILTKVCKYFALFEFTKYQSSSWRRSNFFATTVENIQKIS